MQDAIKTFSSFIWGWPLIILLLGTHIYLTVRLRFPQRHLLKAIKLSATKDPDSKGEVSQFSALATALAATIGTGNIIGVATAISLGGPGAVFWCWISGVFGISTKYSESLLSVKYRQFDSEGRVYGGPMYVLKHGLGWKKMGMLFAIFTALAAFGTGSTVQANAISTLLDETFGISPVVSGIILTGLGVAVIVGGIQSISKVCTYLVPVMAAIYVLGCLIILGVNYQYIWPAVKLIVESAFQPAAAGGGFVGAGIMMACRFGVARGLFSNESGLGSAPIVAAAAQTRNPVRQALISSTATLWDTVVVCALTGLVIVSTILAYPDVDYHNGAILTKMAFSKLPYLGAPLLTVGLVAFAFSTTLGWEVYGERAVEFLGIKHLDKVFRWLYIASIFIGAVMSLGVVWDFADCMNAFMAIPNLLCLLFMSGVLVKETRKYLVDGSIDDYEVPEEAPVPTVKSPDEDDDPDPSVTLSPE